MTHIVSGGAESEHARSLVQRIVVTLESIAGLDQIWKRGVVHRGGPHYRLRGSVGPVSIGEDECFILATLIARLRPAHCFVIGNGFWLSSAFIAKMMEANGCVVPRGRAAQRWSGQDSMARPLSRAVPTRSIPAGNTRRASTG